MRQLALRCLGPRAAPPHRYGNTWERRGDGEERERERLGGRSEGMETSVCWKGAIDLSKVSHRSDVNPLLPEPRVLRSQNEYSNYRWKKNTKICLAGFPILWILCHQISDLFRDRNLGSCALLGKHLSVRRRGREERVEDGISSPGHSGLTGSFS